MKKLLFILLLFVFSSCLVHPSHVIIIMGPSCAGKSTLSKELLQYLKTLDTSWRVIDIDDTQENIELLIKAVNESLLNNHNIIIDTNMYDEILETELLGNPTVTKIILSAPLQVLLERDLVRTKVKNRSPRRAYWCRHFVITSFEKSITWPGDLLLDSSQHTPQENCLFIIDYLKNHNLFIEQYA